MPEFKQLDDCQPRDLVRLKSGGRVAWTLIGVPGNEYQPVLILNQDGSAEGNNVVGTMEILMPDFEAPALRYGQSYTIEPNHAGSCDLSTSAETAESGALVLTTTGTFIKGSFVGRQNAAYYDLASGRLMGPPGGPLAVFGEWDLSLLRKGREPLVVYSRRPKNRT